MARPRARPKFRLVSPGGAPADCRAMSKSFARIVLVVALAFFAVFFLWPVLQILRGGFLDADGRLTFAFLFQLLRSPLYLAGLGNSFLLAVAATALALAIALPLALVADRYRYPAKGLLASLILVPMILIEVPFSKWSHLAYRPFAAYFHQLKKHAVPK